MGNGASSDDERYRSSRAPTRGRSRAGAPSPPPSRYVRNSPPTTRTSRRRSPSPPPSRYTRQSPERVKSARSPRPATSRRPRSVSHSPRPPTSAIRTRRSSMSPPRRSRPKSVSYSQQLTEVRHFDDKPEPKYKENMNTYDEYDENGHRLRPRTGGASSRPSTARPNEYTDYDEPPPTQNLFNPANNHDQDKLLEARKAAAERVRKYKEDNNAAPDNTRPETAPAVRVTTAADKPRKAINFEMQKQSKAKKNKPMDSLHPNYVPSDGEDDDFGPDPNEPPDSGYGDYDEQSYSVPFTPDSAFDYADAGAPNIPPPSQDATRRPSSSAGGRPTTSGGRWVKSNAVKPKQAGHTRAPDEHPPLPWEQRERSVQGHRAVSNKKGDPPRRWQNVHDPSKKTPKWHSDFVTDDYF